MKALGHDCEERVEEDWEEKEEKSRKKRESNQQRKSKVCKYLTKSFTWPPFLYFITTYQNSTSSLTHMLVLRLHESTISKKNSLDLIDKTECFLSGVYIQFGVIIVCRTFPAIYLKTRRMGNVCGISVSVTCVIIQSNESSRWVTQNSAATSLSEIQEQEEKNRLAHEERMRELEAKQRQLQSAASHGGWSSEKYVVHQTGADLQWMCRGCIPHLVVCRTPPNPPSPREVQHHRMENLHPSLQMRLDPPLNQCI